MKKWLLILLLAGSVTAGPDPMADSIEVEAVASIDAKTGTDLFWEMNRAYQQVTTAYPSYERIDTVEIDSVLGRVAVPSDFRMMIACEILKDSRVRIPLRPVPDDSLAEVIRAEQDVSDEITLDQKYWQVTALQLYTYPRWIRDDTATFEIRYYAYGAKLTTGDSIQTDEAYRHAVFLLTCAEAQAARGRYNSATWYTNQCELRFGPLTKRDDEE